MLCVVFFKAFYPIYSNISAPRKPFEREFVALVQTLRPVPLALVDRHHAPRVTRDSAVGEEVGGVGEDHVEARGGEFRHELEAVAVVKDEAGVLAHIGGLEAAGRGKI